MNRILNRLQPKIFDRLIGLRGGGGIIVPPSLPSDVVAYYDASFSDGSIMKYGPEFIYDYNSDVYVDGINVGNNPPIRTVYDSDGIPIKALSGDGSEYQNVLPQGAEDLSDSSIWSVGSAVVTPLGDREYQIDNGGTEHLAWQNLSGVFSKARTILARTVSGVGSTSLLVHSGNNVLTELTEEWKEVQFTGTPVSNGQYFYVVDFRNAGNTLDSIIVKFPMLSSDEYIHDYIPTEDVDGVELVTNSTMVDTNGSGVADSWGNTRGVNTNTGSIQTIGNPAGSTGVITQTGPQELDIPFRITVRARNSKGAGGVIRDYSEDRAFDFPITNTDFEIYSLDYTPIDGVNIGLYAYTGSIADTNNIEVDYISIQKLEPVIQANLASDSSGNGASISMVEYEDKPSGVETSPTTYPVIINTNEDGIPDGYSTYQWGTHTGTRTYTDGNILCTIDTAGTGRLGVLTEEPFDVGSHVQVKVTCRGTGQLYIGDGASYTQLYTLTDEFNIYELESVSGGTILYIGVEGDSDVNYVEIQSISTENYVPVAKPKSIALKEAFGGKGDGVELSTNGSFDTDSDWAKGTGVTISNGKARFNTSGNISNALYQDMGINDTDTYIIITTITDYVKGYMDWHIGGDTVSNVTEQRSSNGVFVDTIKADTASNGFMIVSGYGDFEASIDVVTVQVKLPATFSLYTQVVMGVGSTEILGGTFGAANIITQRDTEQDIQAINVGGGGTVTRVSAANDGSTQINLDGIWSRNDIIDRIVETNPTGTEFRVGYRNITLGETDFTYSYPSDFDGSFDPEDAVRFFFDNTIPIDLSKLLVSSEGERGECLAALANGDRCTTTAPS